MANEKLDELFQFTLGGINRPIMGDPAHLLRLAIELAPEAQRQQILTAGVALLKSTLQSYVAFLDQVQAIRAKAPAKTP
jgi:hypothetical protein